MKTTILWVLIAVYILFGCQYLGAAGDQIRHNVNTETFTANGFLKAGCYGVFFFCASGATCTVAGMPLASSTGVTIPLPANSQANDIPYTVTGGSLYALTVR